MAEMKAREVSGPYVDPKLDSDKNLREKCEKGHKL
jgi:hypothetical protein